MLPWLTIVLGFKIALIIIVVIGVIIILEIVLYTVNLIDYCGKAGDELRIDKYDPILVFGSAEALM